MANFTLSDYKLQAYLLANAEELIIRSGRSLGVSFSQYVKKLEGTGNSQQLAANALNASQTVDFISDLPDQILQQLKLSAKVYKVFINNTDNGPRELPILLSTFDLIKENIGENSTGAADRGYLNRFDISSEENIKQNPGDPGVQIENIEIVRLGGNPAEIDTNITVKISLFATSLQQYFIKYKHAPSIATITQLASDGLVSEDIGDQALNGIAWIDLIKMNLEEGGLDPFANVAKKYGIDVQQGLEKNIFGSTLAYNNDQQRIKLEIGYRDPVQSLTTLVEEGELDGSIYTPDQIAIYAEQIKAQTEVYYLNLHQNAFNFNSDDGSVQLQIDYVASTGTAMIDRKNDLLFDPYLYEKELQANDAICKIQKNIDNEEGVIVNIDPFGPNVLREGSRDGEDLLSRSFSSGLEVALTTEEEKKKALSDLDNLKKRLQVLQANKLINGLYADSLKSATAFRATAKRTKIKRFTRTYILFAPTDDVKDKISGKISPEAKLYNLGEFYYENFNTSAYGTRIAAQIRELQRVAQASADAAETAEELVEKALGDRVNGDEVNIEFVFFSDLIETAFEILAANNRLTEGVDFFETFASQSSNVNIIRRNSSESDVSSISLSEDFNIKDVELYVSPFYYKGGNLDPRIQELYKEYGELLLSNVTYKNPADINQEITISLGDVPISMIEFKKWFVKNISTKRKRHLFMKNYLESLTRWVSKQIGDAVSEDQSTTTDLEPPEMLVNRYFLNVEDYDFLPLITNTAYPSLQFFENRVPITDLSRYIDTQAITENLNSKVLTIMGQTPSVKFNSNRAGNKVADRADKIPHVLFAESDKGLLFNIIFQREDMPGLREARLFEGTDMYGLEILREKYNATLEFYGNNFFKPGTIFYIDPGRLNIANFGYTADGRSPARLLGLGGYYLVIRVTHQLETMDNRWRTTVDAQWQTFGDDDGLFARDQEDDCITSITARLQNAIDLNDPNARREISQQAVQEAIRTGYVGDVQDLAGPLGEQLGEVELTSVGVSIVDPDDDNAPVGVFVDED